MRLSAVCVRSVKVSRGLNFHTVCVCLCPRSWPGERDKEDNRKTKQKKCSTARRSMPGARCKEKGGGCKGEGEGGEE